MNAPTHRVPQLALRTLGYSLLLAALMQGAHTAFRVALTLLVGAATLPSLAWLLGELANKVAWSVLVCEGVVLLSVLARRRALLLVLVAVVLTVVGVVMGQALRALIESLLAQLSTFDFAAALGDGIYRGGKYFFLGAALALVNRLAEPTLRHYVFAGGAASLVAILVSLLAHAGATLLALGSELLIEIMFPLGCALVAWKVTQWSARLTQIHQQVRAQLRQA